ncbi:MAG: TetR family transcriptional regulator [Pseudonocardiaceae bacterium]|nr:TetR family transcriptional regulator [Pseudonocardiaceae bacterium]
MSSGEDDASTRERILTAAEELFAESGFDATPTSRIAERAAVPKGLVHYYFRRKPDLLVALVGRMPEEHIDHAAVVVPGDLALTLRRLVDALDSWLDTSSLISHLLWREADTHDAVREALAARFDWMVAEIRAVIGTALPGRVADGPPGTSEAAGTPDVASASELLALAVSYRHSTARHASEESGTESPLGMPGELDFLAEALLLGAGQGLSAGRQQAPPARPAPRRHPWDARS